MKLTPSIVKSLREREGVIAVLFEIGSVFLVEERSTEKQSGSKYTIVNQTFFNRIESAEKEFNKLLTTFKKEYAEAGDISELFVHERNKTPDCVR